MSFAKFGVAPIESVHCSCGEKVSDSPRNCRKCGKEFVPADLSSEPKPSSSQKSTEEDIPRVK